MHNNTWSDYSTYLAKNSLIAGFTNQNFQYSSTNDRIEFAKTLKLDHERIVIPMQIHSSNVTICKEPGYIADTDGIISNNRNLILSIQVADCIPVFIYDKNNYNIGLLHAGWRGVASNIIENGIDYIRTLDSKSNDINILLGPSIRQCCFEVGPEVGELFDNKFLEYRIGDRMHLNLQSVVIDKLINMNIQSKNIFDVKKCTCCLSKYHSFRRDSDMAGRMIAMMGWQS